MAALNTLAPMILAQNIVVNANSAGTTPLYSVPTAKNALITAIVMGSTSITLGTAGFSFGFNGTTANDVIANGTYASVTAGSTFQIISPKAGASIGTQGQTLNCQVNTAQGAAGTAYFTAFGFLY